MTTPPPPSGDAWQNTPGMNPEQGQPQQWGAPPPPGQGGGYGGAPAKPSNGLGTAALVLGILGLVSSIFLVGGFLGFIAVILGFIARGKVKRGEATNGGSAMAGIITGILAVLISAVIIFAVGSLFNNAGFGNYAECVEAAGEDQAKLQKCADDFANRLGGQ